MFKTLPVSLEDLAYVLMLAVFAFLLSIVLTPIYTKLAYKHKWWKGPRAAAMTGEKAKIVLKQQSTDKHKRRFPTMAGMVMVVAIIATTLLLNLSRSQTYLPLAALAGAGLVGLFDDILSLRSRGSRSSGMNFKIKFLLISIVALLGGFYFFAKLGYTTIHFTYLGDITLGVWLVALFWLVVVSIANAVNISDGLDGLSGGLMAIAFGTYGAIALLQGNIGIAGFCLTIVGVLMAYIWFNIYPARFMMGDVGSFALGTALGAVAMLTNTIPLLIIIGGVFVIEAGSSLIQIFSKKLRGGRKVFKAAPIHHHFVALGWPETKVTMRFWVLGVLFAVLGFVMAVTDGHI